jgi:hypothetical protein
MDSSKFTTEELASEEWRDIPGFPNYQVSNLGRVRSVRITIMKANKWNNDYLRLTLFKGKQSEGKFKSFGVHQLVALAFIGKRPEGHIVNHLDCDKTNNKVQNLAYCTPQGNAKHASENGLLLTGDQNPSSKLKESEVLHIFALIQNGHSLYRIAKRFGTSQRNAYLIKHRLAWSHLLNQNRPLPDVPRCPRNGKRQPCLCRL